MKNIKLLDCTLRECASYNLDPETKFTEKFIEFMISSKVDYIEIGFLKEGKNQVSKNIFEDVSQIDQIIGKWKEKNKFVALIDYGRFNVKKLPCASETFLWGIRICFKKYQVNDVISDIRTLVDKGYCVFVQHVDIMDYTEREIISFIQRLNGLGITGYSIVDTFGTMYLEDLERLYSLVENYLDRKIVLGFHGHNNKMMANALAMQLSRLINDRQLILDSTILGAGRGAGNANTEILMDYLNNNYGSCYQLDSIIELADQMLPVFENKLKCGYCIPYFLAGLYDAHTFIVDYLLEHPSIRMINIKSVLAQMSKEEKKKYNYSNIDKMLDEICL